MDADKLDYAVWWSPEDDAYLACAVGFAGTLIHGATPQKALNEAVELAQEWINSGVEPPNDVLTARDVKAAPSPVWTVDAIRSLRQSLALSQAVFADVLNVDLGTVRSWEQGVRTPSGASAKLLELVAKRPGLILRDLYLG